MTTADTWAEATFPIEMYQGGIPRPEDVSGETWGAWGIDVREPGLWWVSHLPTGRALGAFFRRDDARQFVAAIDPLLSWETLTLDAWNAQPRGLRRHIRQLRDQWGGR